MPTSIAMRGGRRVDAGCDVVAPVFGYVVDDVAAEHIAIGLPFNKRSVSTTGWAKTIVAHGNASRCRAGRRGET